LKLADIEELCASARFCHRAGGIWNLVPASNDQEKKQISIEETCDCSSGHLVIMNKKTGKIIEPKLAKSIVLIEDPAMALAGQFGCAVAYQLNLQTAKPMRCATELLFAAVVNLRISHSVTAVIILKQRLWKKYTTNEEIEL
jgi:hypothetical protein